MINEYLAEKTLGRKSKENILPVVKFKCFTVNFSKNPSLLEQKLTVYLSLTCIVRCAMYNSTTHSSKSHGYFP